MRRFTPLFFICVFLACGNGGSNFASGGVGGSGITQGAITSIGSIVVNDVRWSIDSASLSDDGAMASPGDFQVGMVVTIEGTRTGATGEATSVEADDAIEGPVDSITSMDADTKELTILGQSVLVDRVDTLFDDSSPGFDFDTIAVDDIVEVHGFIGASIVATRVERIGTFTGEKTEIEVKGSVLNLDLGSGTFSIGSLTVNYDPDGVGTDLDDMPGGQVANGDLVEVHGTLLPGGEVSADSTFNVCIHDCSIELEGPFEGDAEDFEIEGLVGNFASLADFEVAGQPVDASGTVEFEPASLEFSIADDLRVEAEGRLVDGVVIATELKLRSGRSRIRAEIKDAADIDVGAGTLLLLGVSLEVTAGTKLEDDVHSVVDFGLDDLSAGDFLAVRGVANGTGVTLSELKRKSTGDVRVRGSVEAFDDVAGTFTILGVDLTTDGSTSFGGFPAPGVSTEAEFYAFLMVNPGATISAKDKEDGNETSFDFADDVEFED
ncbi:MAG: hypothetical protein HRU01_04310 [Myxococcales bacterium]|nr:hypothetical protein [Myxococcales bacterium]